MLEVVVILVVAAALLAFVAAPLLRSDAAEAERVARSISNAAELQSRHDMLLTSLKDLEDDHATGKIDDADYGALKRRLTAEAVETMRQLDAAKERQARPVRSGPRPLPDRGSGSAERRS